VLSTHAARWSTNEPRLSLPKARAVVVLVLLACVLAVFGAVPVSALGATFVLEAGDEILIQSGSGEQNDVTITSSGNRWLISDTGTPAMFAFSPCTTSGTTASCPALGHFLLMTGDMDDHVTLATDAYEQAIICGGDGNDTIVGGPRTNVILGGPGNDSLTGGSAADIIDGEATCPGEGLSLVPGDNTIDGGGGDDTISGGDGVDDIQGGSGADTVQGLGGDDTLNGGQGADNLFGDDGTDLLVGGEDGDFLNGGAGNDVLLGGPGDDILGETAPYGAVLEQDTGNDDLQGQEGDDQLFGGPGEPNDTDSLSGGPGQDSVSYFDRTSSVGVTMDGNANDGSPLEQDNVQGDVETVIGGSGNDTLIGGTEADTIDGGPGNDSIDGGLGDDSLLGGAGGDSLLGGEGRDSLRGDDGDDHLDAGAGQDVASGGGGNDVVLGGEGPDTLEGGAGLDVIRGGSGNDHLEGGSSTLRGADGADTLEGGPGSDTLGGGPGRDRLDGGTGGDELNGGEGADLADYSRSDKPVQVTLDGKANDGARGEKDNVAPDVENVLGDTAKSTLTGNAGPNSIDGGPGEDLLDGGPGSDALQGGDGADMIRSRDGVPDRVDCGAGNDFAIVDRQDIVSDDCEWVDGLAKGSRESRQPILISPTGVVKVGLPGSKRSFRLEDSVRVPLSTRINAIRGSIAIKAPGGPGLPSGAGVLSGGGFVVHHNARTGLTDLHLMDGGFAGCRGATPAPDGVVGSLSGQITRGLIRARGRYVSVRARRAKWKIEDHCEGTRVTVSSGRAAVFDLARRKTVIVSAGQEYEARR
jgi:Ca2+-binding RTX toxin-like protein